MINELLKIDYGNNLAKASRLKDSVIEQISNLLSKQSITLGTPIESRIKTLQSIEEKINRKEREITSVTEFDDFVGIRIIVLFKSDIDKICELVKDNFNVINSENVAERLGSDQFGYQSTHYTVQLPKDWLSIPTLSDLSELKAEIQIRTLSQHIWAVASHKLQYKQENSVPIPLRRAINRVSALLETVDLEFERVLMERQQYKNDQSINPEGDNILNVDLLEGLCDTLLPKQNKNEDFENYAELLDELLFFDINTSNKFKILIETYLEQALVDDNKRVKSGNFNFDDEIERAERGVFFTHVGLVRCCLELQFGDDYLKSISLID